MAPLFLAAFRLCTLSNRRGGMASKVAMRLLTFIGGFAVIGIGLWAGCAKNESPQQIRQQTAQATADLKRDATAVAQGVREGWNRDKPLNLNAASKDDLVSLPGVTAVDAGRIIDGRPYDNPHQLVSRQIVSQTKYDKFADRVVAKR